MNGILICLANFDLDILKDVGFDGVELDKIMGEAEEDDFDAEAEAEKITEPITKTGDLYVFGDKHRILCGDSCKKEDVEKLMDGKKADMVFTDPPYGMYLDADFSDMKGIGGGNKYDNVIGDHEEFDPRPFIELFDYCKEQFWWGADYYAERIPKKNEGSWQVWDKMRGGEGVNDNYDKMFGSNFELVWSRQKHKRALVRVLWKGIFGLSKEDTKKRVHPTQKPTELCNWFINKFSKQDNIIVDLFGGSFSTMIACHQTNRVFYGMEIDPKYCEVGVKRLLKLDPSIKITKNGEEIDKKLWLKE